MFSDRFWLLFEMECILWRRRFSTANAEKVGDSCFFDLQAPA